MVILVTEVVSSIKWEETRDTVEYRKAHRKDLVIEKYLGSCVY